VDSRDQARRLPLIARKRDGRVRLFTRRGFDWTERYPRISAAEAHPEVVALAKQLSGQRMSYRKISAELAARGHLTATGKPYVASAIQTMLAS
jgi:ATP-dependent DNA ligase